MDNELILSGYTYREGNMQLNMAFSGVAEFNGFSCNSLLVSGGGYAVSNNDTTIIQTVGGNITLPGVYDKGRMLTIKNSSGGPAINIIPFGSETIDGVGGPYMLLNNECITIQSRGTIWYIISKLV